MTTPTFSSNAQRVLEARYLRRDARRRVIETPEELFERVARAVAHAELLLGGPRQAAHWEKEFHRLLTSLDFLPNSPTLMNAGTPLGQLSACFVLPVEDSMESIFDAVKQMALVQRTGGGTGFSFSRLRAKGSKVRSTGGEASGPVSFMKIFDCATENIKLGGKRRGANMGVLEVDHPDILEFITAKRDEGELRNFNLSVGVTDSFSDRVPGVNARRSLEKRAHFIVARLREVLIPGADGKQRGGRHDAYEVVDLRSELIRCRGRWTGTATMIRAGCCRRSATTAARMVEPVAMPSSTRITVRPRTSGRGRLPRYASSRRSSSRSSVAADVRAPSLAGRWSPPFAALVEALIPIEHVRARRQPVLGHISVKHVAGGSVPFSHPGRFPHSPHSLWSVRSVGTPGCEAAKESRSVTETTPTTLLPETTGAPLTCLAVRSSIASRSARSGLTVITSRVMMSRSFSIAAPPVCDPTGERRSGTPPAWVLVHRLLQYAGASGMRQSGNVRRDIQQRRESRRAISSGSRASGRPRPASQPGMASPRSAAVSPSILEQRVASYPRANGNPHGLLARARLMLPSGARIANEPHGPPYAVAGPTFGGSYQ